MWVKFPLADFVPMINPFTFISFRETLLRGLITCNNLVETPSGGPWNLPELRYPGWEPIAPCGWSELGNVVSIKYTPASKESEKKNKIFQ